MVAFAVQNQELKKVQEIEIDFADIPAKNIYGRLLKFEANARMCIFVNGINMLLIFMIQCPVNSIRARHKPASITA